MEKPDAGLRMDPVVRRETEYIVIWVLALSAVMEAVFLLLGKWALSVLWGNLAGAAAAVGNYALIGRMVTRAMASGDAQKAARIVTSSRTLRLLGVAGICALCIGVLKTNVYATLIPLLFPRIGLAFRPMVDKKRGKNTAGSQDDHLLD